MILIIIISWLSFSNADVCRELIVRDDVTLDDLINAGCALSHIRERREETYHDVHAVGEDHNLDLGKESEMQICEEAKDSRWCPFISGSKSCYVISGVNNNQTGFCKCTDSGGINDNIKWDITTASCMSDVRTSCTSSNAFFRGVCYDNNTCIAASLIWNVNSTTSIATCASIIWWCGKVGGTKYTAGNSTVAESCKCPEEGDTWHNTHCHAADKAPNKSAAWGYGIIATAIISAFAVFGVVIVLFRDQWWYDIVLSTMVALAVGCLLADALLHLIPLALGLHSHDHGGDDDHGGHDDHAEEGEENPNNILHKTLGILGGVYLFLLFEKAIHSVIPHEHGNKVIENPATGNELKDLSPRRESMKSIARSGICNVDSVAWMVIFGDALHNFADGLVMGASFITSLSLGLGTSVAVFCHEVPHELGDFAVLLNAGMEVKWAVIFNFVSACTCFLGLFLGLVIGEDTNTQQWIFAFTAGMFIYISCADLIPEMNRMCENSNYPKTCFALQQVGFFIGVLIMLIIALFEEDLEAIGGGGGHNH